MNAQVSSTEAAGNSAPAESGTQKPSGQLVIIGGAEDKEGECFILREFLRRAGGLQARIAVITAATSLPGEVGSTYIRVFERLGAERVDVVDTANRDDSNDERFIEVINQATGIFFTGGDQTRITDLIKGTKLDEAMHQRYADGCIIAGTSAGAAMMPRTMIIGGDSETSPRVEIVDMDPGMGFLPGVVIDQHFSQRGRLGRLLAAVAQKPHLLGIGIDENTAIAVSDGEFEVLGEGTVTIVDLGEVTHSNLEHILRDEDLALCNVKLHILPHGYRFVLKDRVPVVESAATV
ncbi:cyanophycinase [Oculatella sp. LEGE 06141]|uniref:cyanophycinase n=1 Tax=Oculatella sp. LEGE 06141 TaxID=1828648 RepID=UPI001881D021|nr:cyanophycinase [Oculatella sp. LEGE 06141]MBE9180100.1 cyanophycinase [Oculatella sp. LEGE 06141]